MKIKNLTKMINDHGTNPRVRVLKHECDCAIVVYEGKPNNVDSDIENLTVNSFTVLGKGFIEIHAH